MDQVQVSENSVIDLCPATQTSSWLRNPNIQHLNRDISGGFGGDPHGAKRRVNTGYFGIFVRCPADPMSYLCVKAGQVPDLFVLQWVSANNNV